MGDGQTLAIGGPTPSPRSGLRGKPGSEKPPRTSSTDGFFNLNMALRA
jgi:hypothetical protein